MAQPQKDPLRVLSEQEERELERLAKATSERLDVVRRAKVVLAVAGGQPFTEAAQQAGLKSGDGVGKLVKRFNQHGLWRCGLPPGQGASRRTRASSGRVSWQKCSESRIESRTRRRRGR